MTDQNLLLQEGGYPNAPADIKQVLRDAAENVCTLGPLTMIQLLNATADRIELIERELAEARKDADRYRWLRANSVAAADFTDTVALVTAAEGLNYESQTDALVDAAMKDKP